MYKSGERVVIHRGTEHVMGVVIERKGGEFIVDRLDSEGWPVGEPKPYPLRRLSPESKWTGPAIPNRSQTWNLGRRMVDDHPDSED